MQHQRIGFVAEDEERFVGFGERSNAVIQAGWTLEHYVADGPYYEAGSFSLDGSALPQDDWSCEEATGVLDVTYTTSSGTLTVTGC